MAPRGRGRGGARTRSTRQPDVSCGLCSSVCGDDAIGCDRCASWFHPQPLCLGLPDDLVKGITAYGGDGIAFICTECRSNDGAGEVADKQAFKQLFQTVRELCEFVKVLAEQMQDFVTGQQDSASRTAHTDESMRLLIREEVREMEERNKRKSSIIIRGLNAPTTTQANEQFQQVATHLLSCQVPLSSIVCINNDKKLYRASVDDLDLRKRLLDSARTLKNSPFSNVYINRDLTFQQRKVLAERRELNRRQQVGGGGGQPPMAASQAPVVGQALANPLN